MNCWSKRHSPCDLELYHPHSPLKNINIKKCCAKGNGLFKGKPFYMLLGTAVSAEKGILTDLPIVWGEWGWSDSGQPLVWCRAWDLDNSRILWRMAHTRFLSCFYNCTDCCLHQLIPSCGKDCTIGNVVCVKTVILFILLGVRHFSNRRFLRT